MSSSAIKALKRLQSELHILKKLPNNRTKEFESWLNNLHNLIDVEFADDDWICAEYYNIDFSVDEFPFSKKEVQLAYIYGLGRSETLIRILLHKLDSSPSDADSALISIQNLCQKFHRFTRKLRSRQRGRANLVVNDEYDVQDILHALLCIYFEDVRREESNPSYGGRSSRCDFFLKKERIALEVKMCRDGLGQRELVEQLVQDIAFYSCHPEYEHIIFFIYDPELRVGNPQALINDLAGNKSSPKVKIIFSPTDLSAG